MTPTTHTDHTPKFDVSFGKRKGTRPCEYGFSLPEGCSYAHSNSYTKGVFTAFLWDLAAAALLVLAKIIKRLYKNSKKGKPDPQTKALDFDQRNPFQFFVVQQDPV